MRSWLVATLLVLAGCNKLLDLEHVDFPDRDGDGGLQGEHDGDIFPDDHDAAPGTPDEDADGIPDASDACPTVQSNGTDSDGDGLPDACDPSSSTQDEIQQVWLFRDQADTTAFTSDNVMWNGLGNGSVQLASDSSITTKDLYLPTRIEVNVRGAGALDVTGAVTVELPTIVSCYVVAQGCTTGASTATCGTVVPSPNTGAQLGTTINGLRRIVFADSSGARCSISSGGSTVTAIGNATFAPSQIAIKTNNKLSITIDSIVLYGLKPPP